MQKKKINWIVSDVLELEPDKNTISGMIEPVFHFLTEPTDIKNTSNWRIKALKKMAVWS